MVSNPVGVAMSAQMVSLATRIHMPTRVPPQEGCDMQLCSPTTIALPADQLVQVVLIKGDATEYGDSMQRWLALSIFVVAMAFARAGQADTATPSVNPSDTLTEIVITAEKRNSTVQ